MVCTITCSVAAAFLGGMFKIMLTKDKEVLGNFSATFDERQHLVMEQIRSNRFRIWSQGIVLGLVLGVIYLYFFGKGLSSIFSSCIFASIVMTVNYFYYMLSNKGTYMIEHLRKDQVDEWLAVKLMYQRKYHLGLLLGIVGCFLLARGFTMI